MHKSLLAFPLLFATLPATAQSFEFIGGEVGLSGVYWSPSNYVYGAVDTGFEVGFGGPFFLSFNNSSLYDGTDLISNTTAHLGYNVSPTVALGVFGGIELASYNAAYWFAGAEASYKGERVEIAGYAGYTSLLSALAANSAFVGADVAYDVTDRLTVTARGVAYPQFSFVRGGIGLGYGLTDHLTAGANYDLSYNTASGFVDHTFAISLTYTFGEGTRFSGRDYTTLAQNY